MVAQGPGPGPNQLQAVLTHLGQTGCMLELLSSQLQHQELASMAQHLAIELNAFAAATLHEELGLSQAEAATWMMETITSYMDEVAQRASRRADEEGGLE